MVKTPETIKIDLSKSSTKDRIKIVNTILEVRRLLKELGIHVEVRKKVKK